MAMTGVDFSYPSRPGHPILRGLNLAADPGQVRNTNCSRHLSNSRQETNTNPLDPSTKRIRKWKVLVVEKRQKFRAK
jgi:hypothetical protein